MTPVPGDRVQFKESGAIRVGTVQEVFIAGRLNGVGIKRQRPRVRVRFDADDHAWVTHRDLDDVVIVAQRDLFSDLEGPTQ